MFKIQPWLKLWKTFLFQHGSSKVWGNWVVWMHGVALVHVHGHANEVKCLSKLNLSWEKGQKDRHFYMSKMNFSRFRYFGTPVFFEFLIFVRLNVNASLREHQGGPKARRAWALARAPRLSTPLYTGEIPWYVYSHRATREHHIHSTCFPILVWEIHLLLWPTAGPSGAPRAW